MGKNHLHFIIFFLILILSFSANSQGWMERTRIIGICNWDNVEARLQEALDARVNVVDIHAEIPGEYKYFLNPDPQLEFIRRVSTRAHQLGLKTVLYIAGLECLSTQGEHTFFKDHPDWVQRNIEGKPAVFNSEFAFWIAPDQEDVWISPLAPAWRRRYMELIEMIATLPIDGIYMDIPYWMTHFEGWTDSWASFDQYTVAEFKRRTGIDALRDLRLGDFSNANFRQWVLFRQQVIKEFIIETNQRIKNVNPQMKFIIELYPGIEFDALTTGGDPYALIPYVDAVSHETNPYIAQSERGVFESLEFYINLLALRAFDREKPSWMLTYATTEVETDQKLEALKNLAALIVMAGANFWETGNIRMCSTTTDSLLRQKIFTWIKENSDIIYGRKSVQRVGLYFSPWSRNFDRDLYLQSFLGMGMLLLQSGYPVEVVTPRTLQQYHGNYLIVPSARILSEKEIVRFAQLPAQSQIIINGSFAEKDTTNREIRLANKQAVIKRSIWIRENLGQQYYQAAQHILNQLNSFQEFKNSPLYSLSESFFHRIEIKGISRVQSNPWIILQADSGLSRNIFTLLNLKGLQPKGNQVPIIQERVDVQVPSFFHRQSLIKFLDEKVRLKKADSNKVVSIENLKRFSFFILED